MNAITSQPGTAVAMRDNSPVGQFQKQLETRANDIRAALPQHITPEKFQRTVLTAVAQNPDLLSADRNSLILSVYKAAQDGLVPDGRSAALVVYNTRRKNQAGNWETIKQVQYLPMVHGIRQKVLNAEDGNKNKIVAALEVGIVYRKEVEAGYFRYEVGTQPPLQHRPMLDLTIEDTTDDKIVGAYSIATMVDGTKSYEFMRRFEIDKVRECSQTGATRDRQGKPREAKGPWVDWFPEMAKKTVLHRHAKSLPQQGDVIFDIGNDPEIRETSSMSAAGVLGSVAGGEAELITDETGDVIDTSTGEVVGTAEPGPEKEAETAGEASQAEPERQPEAAKEETQTAETTTGDAPAETDEMGITKDPAENKADEIIGSFKQAATIIDLNRLRDEAQQHIDVMPDEVAAAVASAFTREEKRLKKQPETEAAQ